MRRNACMLCFALLCALGAAPVQADPVPAAQIEPTRPPKARPASPEELERYQEREEKAPELERFEGGRRGGTIAVSTVIIILLVVILVLILI